MSKSELKSIPIDLDVYKAIVMKQRHFDETPNSVLRRLLGLPAQDEIEISELERPKITAVKRHRRRRPLPEGLQLHKTYKDIELHAKIQEGKVVVRELKDDTGKVVVEGKAYNSPSAAACEITGNQVNGWTFWKFKNPTTGEWELLKYF